MSGCAVYFGERRAVRRPRSWCWRCRWRATCKADPAADALAKLNELSRQAVQSREAVTAAQRDADARLAAQTAAEDRHRADLAALEAANSQLEPYQAAVDRVAAMDYISGRTGQLAAVLTAASPQQLIDQLSLQRAIAAETADQMKAYPAGRERAAAAAQASEKSAADARAAAERSAAVRADLQAKCRELQRQIAAAEAQYAALTPQQQAVIDNAGRASAATGVRPFRQTRRSSRCPARLPATSRSSSRGRSSGYPGGVARRRRERGRAAAQHHPCRSRHQRADSPRSRTSTGSGRTQSRGIRTAWRSTS